MAIFSDILALTLQATNDNPDLWGEVLNDSVIKLIESSFDTTTVDVTTGDVTLADTQGSDTATHYRYGILNVIGAPGIARNVNLPVDIKNGTLLKKAWLVVDNTTGGDTITFKTATGAGVALTANEAVWCYCDGTDIKGTYVASAGNAATADLATDSLDAQLFDGLDSLVFGQLDVRNTWTKGQVVARLTATESVNIVTCNIDLSNSFYMEWAGNWQLGVPGGTPVNGDQFSIVIQQAAGAPHTISFATTTYIWEGGTAPALSTVAGQVDYLAFEYCSDITGGGGQWIGTVMNNVS
ncbi:MAG: hypothetical protein ACYSW3_09160 [Planctomycetota bacterium]|jgi:hypothetical protein